MAITTSAGPTQYYDTADGCKAGKYVDTLNVDADPADGFYTYKEVMDALDVTVTNFVYQNYNTSNAKTGNTREFYFRKSGGLAYGHDVIIHFRTVKIRHEISGSTRMRLDKGIWITVMGANVTTHTVGGSPGEGTLTFDAGATAQHHVKQGYVSWHFPDQMYSIATPRPYDNGDPLAGGAYAVQAELCGISGNENQRLEVDATRLEISMTRKTQRQDFDTLGGVTGYFKGIVNCSTSGTSCKQHWGASDLEMDYINMNDIYGIYPDFSFTPPSVLHPYLGVNTRKYPKLAEIRMPSNGQLYISYVPYAKGTTTRLLIEDLSATAVRPYLVAITGTPNDMIWMDAKTDLRGDDSIYVDLAGDGEECNIFMCRSVFVTNRDSSGTFKTSKGFVIGNQVSTVTSPYSNSDHQNVVPQATASPGTTVVRPTNLTDGKGLHSMIDQVKTGLGTGGNGTDASHYVTYDVGNNFTWNMSRGSLTRVQQNIDISVQSWDHLVPGIHYNADFNDVPGLETDLITDVFNDGWVVDADAAFSGGATTITVDGLSSTYGAPTNALLSALKGIEIYTGATKLGDISTATISGSQITFGIAGAGLSQSISDDEVLTVHETEIGWDFVASGSDSGFISVTAIGTITKDLTYTALLAYVQSKVESVCQIVFDNIGDATVNFAEGDFQGATVTALTELNKIIDTDALVSGAAHYGYWDAGNNRTKINRLALPGFGSSTITLHDDLTTPVIDFGSTITISGVSGLTVTGEYVDSTGINGKKVTVNIPPGTVAADYHCSISTYSEGSASRLANTWYIEANPTLSDVAGQDQMEFIVLSSWYDYADNTNDEWSVAIVGKTSTDYKTTFTALATSDITLVVDPLALSTAAFPATGTVTWLPYDISGDAGSNSETPALISDVTVGTTYPKAYIDSCTHLSFSCTDLRTDNTDAINVAYRASKIMPNVTGGTAREFLYADFISRYGTAPVEATTKDGIDLDSTYFRVESFSGASLPYYLRVDGGFPAALTGAGNTFWQTIRQAGTYIFYLAPTYSSEDIERIMVTTPLTTARSAIEGDTKKAATSASQL